MSLHHKLECIAESQFVEVAFHLNRIGYIIRRRLLVLLIDIPQRLLTVRERLRVRCQLCRHRIRAWKRFNEATVAFTSLNRWVSWGCITIDDAPRGHGF